MLEIEIRAKITSHESVEQKIIEMGGVFVCIEKQIDKIFGRNVDLDSEHKIIEGRFSARIRQRDNLAKVEFKEIRRSGIGLEFSAPILKIADGEYLLKNLDYIEAFNITKTRKIFQLGDYEISLDQVEKLGNFIEIEYSLPKEKNKQAALLNCGQLLKQIDPSAEIESKKYGDLMQEIINMNK